MRRPTAAAWAIGLSVVAFTASAQRLVEWTEGPGELGLGYPVPIPVDTPLPFDGFRSYDGLHLRHQDLAAGSNDLDGQVIGSTLDGREIWAYVLGDSDDLTPLGLPESAMLVSGTVHAREWQSPEVVTAVLERFMARRNDGYLYRYLLDHARMVVIPVLNVDAFLQTQRFPTENYLGSDGNAPRDGRMRRKNMNGVDEDILTVGDHLLGVDLNRNNPPFWGSGNQNTPVTTSLVHRGTSPQSEPESQALAAAAALGPENRLRVFTDVHSFGQIQLSVNTFNNRRNRIQAELLLNFTNFQRTLPGGKSYAAQASGAGGGIGSTDEYFANTYEIPSWTLETEPLSGGVDYGGLGSNGHDGFILPESEIARVRSNLSQGFAILWYRQAGPPTTAAAVVSDVASGAVVYDAAWDVTGPEHRVLYQRSVQPLTPGREYDLWLAFDKPMRWRNVDGEVIRLPGQGVGTLLLDVELEREGSPVATLDMTWLAEPGGAPNGTVRYRDDAIAGRFSLPDGLDGEGSLTLAIDTSDMVGQRLDSRPDTVVDWRNGAWAGYENEAGTETDSGGPDRSMALAFSTEDPGAPFTIEAGVSGAWFDPSHDGEGFLLEVLDARRAVVYWFTYDDEGRQRWMVGEGEITANQIRFPDLIQTSGARFGTAFDPADVARFTAGSARLLWPDCQQAALDHAVDAPRLRQQLIRLSGLLSLDCGGTPSRAGVAAMSGTWYDPDRDGEGFVVQALAQDRVLVYWFTYDPDGNQAWIVGDGTVLAEDTVLIEQALITRGGRFGDGFDPAEVEREFWGRLEFQLGCQSGRVDYEAADPAFGAGRIELTRLSRLPGLDCAARGDR